MITLDRYITSDGKFPERGESPELHRATVLYASELLIRVNKALKHLGIEKATVSSGFRTSAANKAAKGSKQSAHMTGQAIDLVDLDGALDKAFTKAILEEFNLYREDSDYTPNWIHLQIRPTKSGKRIFKP